MNNPQNGLGGGQFNPMTPPNFGYFASPFQHQFLMASTPINLTSTPAVASPAAAPSSSDGSNNVSSSSSSGLNSSGSPDPESKEAKMTRSSQYKKIMKPLLERKRRARINKCLDELKDIMTAALQAQGENVSKLEKADILELTVRHLHKMQQARRLLVTNARNPLEEIHRFQAGYSSCAQEAASFLLSTPGVDVTVGQRLLAHLSSNMANPIASALQSRLTPVHQPLPPAVPPTSTTTSSSSNSARAEDTLRSTPLRRSSSPSMGSSPSKRLFHSPPLSALSPDFSPPPPRPSSTPVNNNNYSVTLSISTKTSSSVTSEEDDEDGGEPRARTRPIKPAPIRLNPNDPVWRPF